MSSQADRKARREDSRIGMNRFIVLRLEIDCYKSTSTKSLIIKDMLFELKFFIGKWITHCETINKS